MLNPSSPHYSELKIALDAEYQDDLENLDAIRLEINSRDFLARVAQTNASTAYLITSLLPFVYNPRSIIRRLYYPTLCPRSCANYTALMRTQTCELKPGYGSLFTIELSTVEAAAAFFDNLNLHKGPSLGSNLTLVQPYVQTVFFREKQWAASWGLQETIVRVSVGLEDRHALLETFLEAIRLVDQSTFGEADLAKTCEDDVT